MLVFLKYKGNTQERGTVYELRPKPFGSVNREYDLNIDARHADNNNSLVIYTSIVEIYKI
jgi:hypothetical protein